MIEPTATTRINDPDPPRIPSWEERAADALTDAQSTIRSLTERAQLLQVKCDTVDMLCSLGKAEPRRGDTVMLGSPDSRYYMQRRIAELLDERSESLRQAALAAAAATAAASANASPDPSTTPLGF